MARSLYKITSLLLFVLAGSAQAQYILEDGTEIAPFDEFQECDVCPEMIVMPPGSFMMGAKPEESRNPFDIYGENASWRRRGPDELNIIPNEYPRLRVEMDIPYAIGRNEVTRSEWMTCVEDGGCSYVPDHKVLTRSGYVPLGPNHPVINVSYLDVQEYAAWLNSRVGAEVYRLPTEAEWEYAARAGTETRFARGDDLTSDQAVFSRGATEWSRGVPMPDLIDRGGLPLPVNELDAANPWGLRHIAGNVFELTLSCYSDQHLGLPTDSAYLADTQAKQSCRRVSKGGAFTSGMDNLRPSRRFRLQFISNDLAQAQEKERGSLAVYATQTGSGSRRRTRDKMLA